MAAATARESPGRTRALFSTETRTWPPTEARPVNDSRSASPGRPLDLAKSWTAWPFRPGTGKSTVPLAALSVVLLKTIGDEVEMLSMML